MFLHRFYFPGLSINSYLIADSDAKKAVVLDPVRDPDIYIQYAKKEGFEITDILETHVHGDFISGSKELKAKLDGKPKIHCSSLGGAEWAPNYADVLLKNKDEVQVGTKVRLQVLHTPGHSPEHIIWICYDEEKSKDTPCLAFTGDLLFVGSVGRPDLLGKKQEGELEEKLYHSLFTELSSLPDFLEIFPGHAAGSLCGKSLSDRPSSTLGYERLVNPYLVKQPLSDWIKKLEQDVPKPPPHFQRIKSINVHGPVLLNDVKVNDKRNPLIIDVRKQELFSEGHLRGSINIPSGGSFCNWVNSVVAEDLPFGIVGESEEQIKEAIKGLHLIGFDQVVMQLIWQEGLLKSNFPIDKLPMIGFEELYDRIEGKAHPMYLLDVRYPLEWKEGHITGANHIELAALQEKMDQVPKDTHVCVICGSGQRASIAASILKKYGYKDVVNIRGGMKAWNQAKFPVERAAALKK